MRQAIAGLAAAIVLAAAAEAGRADERAHPAASPGPGAQAPGVRGGAWRYIGGDSGHTRYSPADQIDAGNFANLEEAWVWDGASFNAASGRSTPVYADGVLYTVAGPRRHVLALDPANGELLWSWRAPHTERYAYSMRKDYGKGVAYGQVDGRSVIYISSPAFFLAALDAKTGRPLAGFGKPVPIAGFPQTGMVDLLADLGHPYDPYRGIDLERGYITASSPPILVGDVLVVGNSAEQGYNQSRIENVPGDILAYHAKTGEFLWKFNVLPGPGEVGHETWENDAWRWTGDISSWAPLSADQERGIVYVPTNGPTLDFYGGFRPGDNLFGTSLIALDVKTGKRVWHYQLVRHDIWNYDTPTAPVLLDVQVGGGRTPIVAQATKQSFVYVFNRATGEPIWPIEDRPVPASKIPGEKLAATQPFPTRPAPFDIQGLTHDDLIDFTPALRQAAIDMLADWDIGPLFQPPLHRDNPQGKRGAIWCPGDNGGANIYAPPAADPHTGVLYVPSATDCTARIIVPGSERDKLLIKPTGKTVADFAALRYESVRGPHNLPLYKPPYSRITAIDLNTGEHLWMAPTGETPARVRNHPALAGLDIGATGSGQWAPILVTGTLLLYAASASDGAPQLVALDKATGALLGKLEVGGLSRYGMMTYLHEGRQYIVLQTGATLTALALPADD